MTRRVYRVDVDRVIVSGVAAATIAGLDQMELRTLIEHAVASRLANAPLPAGPAAHTTVQVTDRSVSAGGAPAVASAVVSSVVRAATVGSRRG